MQRKVDVAILGGGLAGNLLARQLRRELPDLSVSIYERHVERSYKVGESTVEVASHYLLRRQQLGTYLHKNHLPKHGLRYFFDNEACDGDIRTMSEIGPKWPAAYPSFQLDRARLERDLLEMNAADGVEVNLGARVTDVEVSDDLDAPHTFTVVTDGERTKVSARWVIDAGGREGIVAKLKDLRVPEKKHRIAAGWGRFTGVGDIDGIRDADAFHRRVNYVSRVLSTNHFMSEGQWIWFIPLREGITSLGIVQDASMWDAKKSKVDGFMQAIRKHKAVRELTEDVECLDYMSFTQLAFRTKRFFGTTRWACIGDAAAFTDPFYSPGSDFISLENDLVSDLIRRDVEGDGYADAVDVYDGYMQYRLDSTMVIYEGLYKTFGSYELYRAKLYFDTGLYYNVLFDPYWNDKHRDLRWVRSELRRKEFSMQFLENFRQLFLGVAGEIKKRGDYFRKNTGHYTNDAVEAYGLFLTVGEPRSRAEIREQNERLFAETKRRLGEILGDEGALAKLFNDENRELYDAWSQLAAT
ncbi:MAG: NAD(P)/FAD-dependent oxidoreductase [Sandaracinaceae bacterium]